MQLINLLIILLFIFLKRESSNKFFGNIEGAGRLLKKQRYQGRGDTT